MEDYSVALLTDSAFNIITSTNSNTNTNNINDINNTNNNNSNNNNNNSNRNSNNNNNLNNTINSTNNNNNNNLNMHHHKDHMLAAGSTPTTTSFMYETTGKPEMTLAKAGGGGGAGGDYAAFGACIQQSSLLVDHRQVSLDANLDAAVSLGALCDLKFASSPTGGASTVTSLMGGAGAGEVETHFKGLPHLITNIEASNLMGVMPKVGGAGGEGGVGMGGGISGGLGVNMPQFAQMLFTRGEPPPPPTMPQATVGGVVGMVGASAYMPLKANEVQNTAGGNHYLLSSANGRHHLAAAAEAGETCESNLMEYGMASSTSSAIQQANNGQNLNANLSITTNSTENMNENHITTTTITTTLSPATTAATNDANNTANSQLNNNSNTNNNNNNNNNNNTTTSNATSPTTNHHMQQQQQHHHQQHQPSQSATSTTSRSTLHSIEELAASSCTPTSSSATPMHAIANTNSATEAATSASATSSAATNNNNNNKQTANNATTVPLVNINNNNNEKQQNPSTATSQIAQQHRIDSQQHVSQQHSVTHQHHQQHQQQHQIQAQAQSQSQSQQQQQQSHHSTSAAAESSQLNSSSLSTDSNDDSMSSSDEYIDMELNDRSGYQDTTSSHSQQSANGGGGGGGGSGPGGGGPASAHSQTNLTPGMSFINGVVTLNTQNSSVNSAGGGNNGGSSASSASGTYMSLLPPAVCATSSSVPHLGVNPMGGTSASASGSTPDVIDFKHLFEELCPVCGDKVSGYHYGLLTCESCKGFFKRTVQNKKVYTCVAERSCHIDKTQRKRCPYCRFQKCLEVGMKLEAVRADRMRGGRNKFGPMYKRDRARKLQVMRQRQIALQALRTSMGTGDMKPTPISPGYQQAYSNMNIKQEIQIPQVSSLTQSPDSSPSPIAIALGQVNASTSVIATPMNGSSSSGGGSGNGGGSGGGNGSSNNNNNNTSEGINRVGSGGGSNCHETGTGSIQSASDSKLCFDSGTHPSSTADSIIEPLRVSPMIREFVQSIDDREWQTQLFALLQKQTYNQVEVDLFELMCKVLDQNLFSQVDWARNTVFFKDLKVDDQMKLLQHSWSDMLVLDHLHQRIHNGLPDETQLNNGQVFNLLGLGLLGVPQLSDYFNELQNKLQELKFDMGDYVCMKFLILLNPDVRGIINKKTVLQGHENVQAALLDYTLTCYPSVTDKFRRLLSILPDIHAMASRGEEHLYSKHCAGSAPTQTLLMEMLHAKRKV